MHLQLSKGQASSVGHCCNFRLRPSKLMRSAAFIDAAWFSVLAQLAAVCQRIIPSIPNDVRDWVGRTFSGLQVGD